MRSPEFPERKNIRFCVWRSRPDNARKILLHFVDAENLAPDDLIFCDSPRFSGYSQIVDFVRNEDGTISDYMLRDAEVDFDTSLAMAKTTNIAVDDYLENTKDEKACVVIVLKSKGTPDRKVL
jgi:hypothetical protein